MYERAVRKGLLGKFCCIAGCSKPLRCRGLCGMHYRRWRKHGDPNIAKPYAGKGNGSVENGGYRKRQVNGRRMRLHVEIAEKALGMRLPKGAVVHHMDEDPSNNSPDNLVICPNQAYHMLIHRRTRAFNACGHAHWRKCVHCGVYDDPINLYVSPDGRHVHHRACDLRHYHEVRKVKKHARV